MSIAGASMGIQFVGQLYAQHEAKRRREEEERLIRKRKGELTSDFANELSTPYFDSAEAMSAQTRMKEQMADVMSGMNANAIKSGSTQEAQIAQRSELNKGYGEFMGNLSGIGSRRRDVLKRRFQNSMDSMFGLELGQAKEDTQSAVNLGHNMSNIGNAGLTANTMTGGQPTGQGAVGQPIITPESAGMIDTNDSYWNWNY